MFQNLFKPKRRSCKVPPVEAMSYNGQEIKLSPDISGVKPSMLQTEVKSTDSRPSGTVEVGLDGWVYLSS